MGVGFLREYTVQDDYALNPDDSYPDDYYEEYEYEDGGGEYVYEDEGENGVDTKLPEEEDLYADYERERKRRRRRRRRQAESYDVETDYDTTFKGGALQTNKTWLFNGNTWEERTPMSIPRDRPACSIINMPNGEVSKVDKSRSVVTIRMHDLMSILKLDMIFVIFRSHKFHVKRVSQIDFYAIRK